MKHADLKLPLKSRELRQTWEKAFDEAYIQPFTKVRIIVIIMMC